MKGIRLARTALAQAALDGCVLTTDLRGEDGHIVLAKGARLHNEHRSALGAAPWDALHLVVLEPGDCHEADAGRRLARAVSGHGVAPGEEAGGQWPIRATGRGILSVGAAVLARVNAHPDLGVYTLFDGQVVDAEETVARAKIIPFAVPEAIVAAGEAAAAGNPPVSVRPFRSCRVSAVVQESLGDRAMQRFRAAFGEKVRWFGGELSEPHFTTADGLASAMVAELALHPDLLVVAGSRAMDPLDPMFEALDTIGATMVRRGMPAHPGSLCWVATRAGVPIVGMPSCGVFSQATVFDLLLTWVFADVPLTPEALAGLGHGGFLTKDMAFRFPPYRRARDRGEVE